MPSRLIHDQRKFCRSSKKKPRQAGQIHGSGGCRRSGSGSAGVAMLDPNGDHRRGVAVQQLACLMARRAQGPTTSTLRPV